MAQLAFQSVLDDSFRERQRLIDRYCVENRERYQGFATLVTPSYMDWKAVWSRLAFAVLSANALFDFAVKALGYANRNIGHAEVDTLANYGMVPAKADYINALPQGRATMDLLKWHAETWHTYRMRLTKVKGLGLAKASFAASLLYPLEADVACVDTHMQKVYLGHAAFKSINLKTYLAVEDKVRKVAHRHSVNTFLAQWMIWDCVRGKVENHAIFPGAHKDGEAWQEW